MCWHGRGKKKNQKLGVGVTEYGLRCASCTGYPIRIAKNKKNRDKDDMIEIFRSPCDLICVVSVARKVFVSMKIGPKKSR